MTEVRGVVEHIAVGFFEGTISWQQNPRSKVSSHFVVARDGRAAQMVDTDVKAWTQGEGNGHWLSVENEGIPKGHDLYRPGWELLTPAQIETNAKIFARAHEVYGVPLQVTDHPDGRGLGHHSMGAEHGRRWGHRFCPGEPIKSQKPLIVARARQLLNQPQEGDLMSLPELRASADGEDVRTAQGLLLARRQQLPKFGIDGDFGDETTAAVKALQKTAGLPQTGVVDEDTWGVLLPGLAGLAQLGTSVAELAARPAVDPVALAAAISAELDIPAEAVAGAVETALRRILAGLAG